MAGRYPKPTALKIVAGNPGKRPLPADEPHYQIGAPDKPEGLDPVASSEWDRMVKLLLENDVLTIADGAGLEAYCRWFALFRQATTITQTARFGTSRHKRAFSQAQQASKEMRQFLVQYGMTPASRPRVHGSQPRKQADPYGKFLESK